jgi:hypothetical protein
MSNGGNSSVLDTLRGYFDNETAEKGDSELTPALLKSRELAQGTEEDMKRAERIKQILNLAWDGERELELNEVGETSKLVACDLGRKAWVDAFQHFRIAGKFQVNSVGYANTVILLEKVLDEVLSSRLFVDVLVGSCCKGL